MRKHVFFVFVLALVFLLSGCSRYTSEYIDELQQKWDDEYFALEEKYNNLRSEYEDYCEEVASHYDDISYIVSYFDEEKGYTYDGACDAAYRLYDLVQ